MLTGDIIGNHQYFPDCIISIYVRCSAYLWSLPFSLLHILFRNSIWWYKKWNVVCSDSYI